MDQSVLLNDYAIALGAVAFITVLRFSQTWIDKRRCTVDDSRMKRDFRTISDLQSEVNALLTERTIHQREVDRLDSQLASVRKRIDQLKQEQYRCMEAAR